MFSPSLPRLCSRRAVYSPHQQRASRPFSSSRGPSERKPRVGENGVVALRVMGAPDIRAVEIGRAAVEVQVLRELQAEPHIPGGIRKRRAVAERDVGEVLDQPVAVRTADVAVVELADAGWGAKDVVA